MATPTTHRLILVRHAKTEQVPGKIDHDRELLPRGIADAQAGGAWLVAHDLVPDLVLCSTATRAQQTWEHLAVGGDLQQVPVWDERRLYNAYPEEILGAIREVPEETGTLAVVAHAPGIPSLAFGLAQPDGSDQSARLGLQEGMPTGVGAVLGFDGPWSDLAAESAQLTGVHRWRGTGEEA